MKSKLRTMFVLPALLALCALHSALSTAEAQGTAFTYQGQLQNNGSPANGNYDFEFSLYTNAAGTGTQVGSTIPQPAIGVTNGLFTTSLDFGAVFTGNATWLAVSVRSNGSGDGFTALTPLQPVLPTPYAVFANTASNLSGTIALAQLSAGTANISISGSAATATTATSATSATTATTATSVGGVTAANVASGATAANALLKTNASFSFFAGLQAGNLTTSGGSNTAIGYQAMTNNTTGSWNTASGAYALSNNTIGSGNAASGYAALLGNTSGSNNTAVGFQALTTNTTGSNNIAVGFQALGHNQSGISNIAIGAEAGLSLNPGSGSNIDIGNPGVAGDASIIRIGNTQTAAYIAGAITGNGAGLTNLNGTGAGFSNLTLTGELILPFNGSYIYAAGTPFVYEDTSENFFAGKSAGNLTMSGQGNTGVGYDVLANTTIGYYNTAIGGFALLGNSTGYANTASGYEALYLNSVGSYNTASGYDALLHNTTGSNNTASGFQALFFNTTGQDNTAIGYNALELNMTAWYNTAIGQQALGGVETGSNNIGVGYQAGLNLGISSSSNIDIGNVGSPGENNIIRIGSNQTIAYIAGVITGNGAGLTNLNGMDAGFSNLVLTSNLYLPGFTASSYANIYAYTGLPSSPDGTLIFHSDPGNIFAGYNAGNLTLSGSANADHGY